ncbi:hypothetical protein N9Z02_02790 [Akkermansiaceae bacterium]|nr:hypothetical protein [Akkermansiaceae bacterium]
MMTHTYITIFFPLTLLPAEIILVNPEDLRVLELSVGSNIVVDLLTLDFGQSSINIDGDGYPNFGSSVEPFSVTAFSQGSSISDVFDNAGVFYTNASGFVSGAAEGLNYARVDIDGALDANRNFSYELVLEFDTKNTVDSSDDVITRYVYNTIIGSSLDVPESLELFFPTSVFPKKTKVTSITKNQSGGVRLIWKSPFAQTRVFSLWSSPDLDLPIDQWTLVEPDLEYNGPSTLNVFDTEPMNPNTDLKFYVIRTED